MQSKILTILIFSLIISMFAIQNSGIVSVTIFTWNYQISLALVVLGAIVFGAVIMGVVSSIKQLKLKKEIRSIIKDKEKLQQKIDKLEIDLKEKDKIEINKNFFANEEE